MAATAAQAMAKKSAHVTFENHRLLVGYRREDWTEVWYEPMPDVGAPDADGAIPFGLYSSSTSTQKREPMEQEVAWFPQFNHNHMEADTKKPRMRMQNIDMHNGWRYLMEDDQDKLALLETELEKPLKRRWQSWFENAKAFKAAASKKATAAARRKAKYRQKKEEARELQIRLEAAGVSADLIGDSLTYDSDSSACESEDDRIPPGPRRAPATPMGPPPGRAPRTAPGVSKKRSRPQAKGSTKKPRTAVHSAGTRSIFGPGLGGETQATVGRPRFEREESRDYDTDAPEPNQSQSPFIVDDEDEDEDEAERVERVAGYRPGPQVPGMPMHPLAMQYNGAIDEDVAFERAMTASIEEQGGWNPEHLQRAVRESMAPEDRPGADE